MQSETREYQKVIDYVSQMIADGQLKIGDRLPTERQIAETLSIGRNSTREALRMLEHIGMISCKRGSGNYLTDNVSRSVSEMVHMMLLLGQTDQAEICSFRRNMEKAVCRAILDGKTFSRWETQVAEILHQACETQERENADRAGQKISLSVDPGDRKPVLDCSAGADRRRLPQVDRCCFAVGKRLCKSTAASRASGTVSCVAKQ